MPKLFFEEFVLKKLLLLTAALALPVTLGACGQVSTEAQEENRELSASLVGAGASFPAPLYQRWSAEYNAEQPDVQISYQSVGSGAGVEQFTQETVDFGASDVAMSEEKVQAVEGEVVFAPMTAGGIVLAYNVEGVDNLQLSREVYTDILLGNITNWSDPAIAEINEGVALPDQEITVVYRSDGSGTTGVFTKHLADISPEFSEQVGEGKTVAWPVGVGAKGNEGVTAQLLQTEGAIGYVEYGYAQSQDISMAALENSSGNYVEPTFESMSETLSAVELPEDLVAFITDPEGENSYPVVTYTWLLLYPEYADQAKLDALKGFLNWSLEEGQEFSQELGYIPLPENVVERVQAEVETIELAQ